MKLFGTCENVHVIRGIQNCAITNIVGVPKPEVNVYNMQRPGDSNEKNATLLG